MNINRVHPFIHLFIFLFFVAFNNLKNNEIEMRDSSCILCNVHSFELLNSIENVVFGSNGKLLSILRCYSWE